MLIAKFLNSNIIQNLNSYCQWFLIRKFLNINVILIPSLLAYLVLLQIYIFHSKRFAFKHFFEYNMLTSYLEGFSAN